MASLSKFEDRVALDLEWFEIRDMMLGRNNVQQNLVRALELAASCKHPEAYWLNNFFSGKDVKTWDEALALFKQEDSDPRALCFSAMATCHTDFDRLGRAADTLCSSLPERNSVESERFGHEFGVSRACSCARRARWLLEFGKALRKDKRQEESI